MIHPRLIKSPRGEQWQRQRTDAPRRIKRDPTLQKLSEIHELIRSAQRTASGSALVQGNLFLALEKLETAQQLLCELPKDNGWTSLSSHLQTITRNLQKELDYQNRKRRQAHGIFQEASFA